MTDALNVILPLLFVAILFIPTMLKMKKGGISNPLPSTKSFQEEEAAKALIRMQQQNNQDFYERHNK